MYTIRHPHSLVIIWLSALLFLCFQTSFAQSSDVCAEATPISIGTCGFPVDVLASYANTNTLNNACEGAPVNVDSWLSFTTTTANERLLLEFESLNKDAAIAVYSTCAALDPLACVDAVNGIGTELLEFTAPTAATYYIRVMNIEDASTLNGLLCLSRIFSRDDCADMLTAPSIETGNCNVRVNVLSTFSTATDCAGNARPASWIKFTASATEDIRIDYLASNTARIPNIALYNSAGFGCAATPTLIACANTTNNLVSLTASVNIGTEYYLKIVNTNPATDMLGQLCIYPENAANDPVGFFAAFSPNMNVCTQFNVLTGFGNTNAGLINNAPANCLPNNTADFNSDAWLKFENLGAADEIFIDYDNNNGETSLPDDAALVIYKGENITTFDAVTSNDYQVTSCFASSGNFNIAQINQVFTDINIGNGTSTSCDGDAVTGVAWFQMAAPGEPFSIVFFNNSQANNQQIDIEIYAGDCAASGANSLCEATLTNGAGFSMLEVNSAAIFNAGVPLYIKVINQGAAPVMGSLGFFSRLTPIACINSDIEGIESIKISDELAGFEANHTYYVRIANVSNGGNESLFGILCVRDQEILPTDLCTTALGLNQGDCGISLPIPLNRDQLQANAEAALCPPSTKTITRDVWAKFTAASTSTTIEYLNSNADASTEDIIISVYRGSCGNNQTLGTLVREVCQDNLAGVVGIETVQLNTIPGLQYFIRISTNAATPVDGRICLQNTNQVNVCEVDNLKTIFVGDCNYRFDIPADFTLDGSNIVNTSGTPPTVDLATSYPNARDAWLRMLGNGQTVTLQYQNNSETGLEVSNPAIVVYTSSPAVIDCSTGLNGAGNPNNELLYVNLFDNTNKQTETISFPTNAGQTYFIRLIDLAPAAVDSRGMTGTFCLSGGNQTAFNTCPTPLPVEIGSCNVRLNITNGISTFNGPVENCSGNSITGVADSWAVVTTPVPAGGETLPEAFITIQYDNSGGSLFPVSDIAIAVYTDCGDLAGSLMGCVDALTVADGVNVEGIESIQIPIDAATGGETFYIRVINKTPQNTSFGKLCIFYGDDITSELCTNASDYGDVRSGEWRSIEIEGDWNTIVPTNAILESACVIPGGASPTSANPPIRSQGWFRFTIPNDNPSIDNEVGIVTIQYDNEGFVEGNPENAAIAVYSSPLDGIVNCTLLSGYNGGNDPRVFANPNTDYTQPNGLYLLGCTNTVWEGTESLTIPVIDGRTYYVRVMNVANRTNPNDMPGRIRIFPFAKCTEGENLVKDGTFQNWGAMDRSAIESPTTYQQIDAWNHPNPGFANYEQTPAAGLSDFRDYARFASVYGYLRDRGTNNDNTSPDRNRHSNLHAVRNELATEGLYTVTHTANTYKGNWFCYGRGYSGYGGNNATASNTWNATYCAAGGEGAGLEACEATCVTFDQNGNCLEFSEGNFGLPSAGNPALVPSAAEANFMLINGLWTDPNLNPNAAKIWCQTITRPNESLNSVGYYVFRAWFQNVKSGRQSGDVPQLKITICDMADPNNPELIPNTNAERLALTPATGNQIVLPGVTRIAGEGPSPTGQTSHIPPPLDNQNMTIPADGNFRYEYGAAMPCNGVNEAPNARLKTLGSSFFVEQMPDTWQLMRCIYRAPRDVVDFNLCIENESLSKNGNDFAIDDISLAECTDANEAAFDRLLKGDACELADNAEFLGLLPLNVTLIDFSGKLFTDYVILDWITVQETGSAYFEVERSLNGRDFSRIGTVDAAGTTDEAKAYNFIDQNLPEGMPYVYYRLKIYDQTAHFKLSAVIQIDLSSINEIDVKLFPNPVESGEVAKLQFMAPQDRTSIVISDMVGNPLYQTNFMTIEGLNEIELDTKGMARGIYIISLAQGTRRVAKKLVVR